MALIKREAVSQQADLQRETVPVPALGGDVVVTELGLDDRLDFEKVLRDGAKRSLHALVPHLLAAAVLDADDVPVFDVKQWRAWGARNRDAAIGLFNTAMRLSGFDGNENAKN